MKPSFFVIMRFVGFVGSFFRATYPLFILHLRFRRLCFFGTPYFNFFSLLVAERHTTTSDSISSNIFLFDVSIIGLQFTR